MRRFLVISIPVAILIVSIFIMIGSPFFKKSRGDLDNVPKYMDTIASAVKSDNWALAEQNASNLESAWDVVLKRAQYSIERDEINSLNVSIARLKAAITVQDKSASLIELGEAKEHWDDLGK